MQTNQFANQQVTEEIVAHQIELSESTPPNRPHNEVLIFMGGLWLLPLVFVATSWIVVLMKQSASWKILRSRIANRDRFQQIPCTNCQFFNNSPYIQCAVHPSRALNSAAIDCPDYCPKKCSKKFSK